MRVQSLLLALLFTLGASLAFAAEPLSAADQVAQMKRGVNIVGYDPIWKDAAKGRFKPRHFKIIKDGGFDTVRINLYGFRQMNEQAGTAARAGTPPSTAWSRGTETESQHRPRRARLRALHRRHRTAAAGSCWRSGRRSRSTSGMRPSR